jgi:hypothetical protein
MRDEMSRLRRHRLVISFRSSCSNLDWLSDATTSPSLRSSLIGYDPTCCTYALIPSTQFVPMVGAACPAKHDGHHCNLSTRSNVHLQTP